MELKYFKDYQELSLEAHSWVLEKIRSYRAQSLYIPAGGSPKGLYALWEKSELDWASNLRLIQIDDVVTGSKAGIFRSFFESNLPSYKNQITFISSGAKSQADLGILGLGLNGHVAFHEPHIEKDFAFGEVQLSEKTISTLGLEENAKGITYGLDSFLRTKALLLIVSGEGKETVFKKFLEKNPSLPVSEIQKHNDLTVLALESLKPQ